MINYLDYEFVTYNFFQCAAFQIYNSFLELEINDATYFSDSLAEKVLAISFFYRLKPVRV